MAESGKLMSKTPVVYVAQVQAGAHCSFEDGPRSQGASLSTYDSLEKLLARAGIDFDIAEGAWIVDAREVPYEDAYTTSVYGPMLDTRPADLDREWSGTHYAFPQDPITDVFVQTVGVNYLGAGPIVAQITATEKPGPLDKVPPRAQARCWAEVGAKVGRWRSGQVDWVAPFADPNQLTLG